MSGPLSKEIREWISLLKHYYQDEIQDRPPWISEQGVNLKQWLQFLLQKEVLTHKEYEEIETSLRSITDTPREEPAESIIHPLKKQALMTEIQQLLQQINPQWNPSETNMKTHLESLKHSLISDDEFTILDCKIKLSKLCLEMEAYLPHSLTSIIFYDKNQNKFFLGAAPSIGTSFFDVLHYINSSNVFDLRDWLRHTTIYFKKIFVHDIAGHSEGSRLPLGNQMLAQGIKGGWIFPISYQEGIVCSLVILFKECVPLPSGKTQVDDLESMVYPYKSALAHISRELACGPLELKMKYIDILQVVKVNEPYMKPSFTVHTDPTGHVITYVSPEVKQVLGIEPTSWMGVKKYVEIHPQDYNEAYKKLFLACKSKITTTSVHRFKRKDGSWVVMEARYLPIINSAGGVSYIYCEIYENTNACKQFEYEIREREESEIKSFHTIKYVENNEVLNCHYVSPEIYDILQITPDNWLGIHTNTVDMYGNDYERCMSVRSQAIVEKQEKTVVGRFRIGNSKEYIALEIHFYPILDPAGNVHKIFTTFYANTSKCKDFIYENPILKLLP